MEGTFSVKEFCKFAGISQSFYYVLKAQGIGPTEIRLGGRRLISRETAAEWLKEREALPKRREATA